MVIPLGLAEKPSPRSPWVTVLIAAACLAVFTADDLHMRSSSPRAERMVLFGEYWADHPYLLPPEDIAETLDQERIARAQEEQEKRSWNHTLPDETTLLDEQREWLAPYTIGLTDSWQFRWGLVPAHGLDQDGWLTHLFMHASWWHLLGNLFFLALVAPALEELTGPFIFLAFYLGMGLLAAACQYLINRSSYVPIIGASGAIAACMGAFTVRFRREQFVLLSIWPRRRREIPAWLWGAVWFGEQLFLLAFGGVTGQGVAVLAHIGGFIVGAGGGVVLSRLKMFAPSVQTSVGRTIPSDLAWADQAAESGRLEDAVHAYRLVLRDTPQNLPALWGLTRALFANGEDEEGSKVFDRVLERWIRSDDAALIQQALRLYAGQIDTKLLRPQHALVVARPLEFLDSKRALWAYENAASAGNPEAVLRLAEILAERGNLDASREMAGQFRTLGVTQPDLTTRLDTLVRTLGK